jgi:hypothetical protein
MKELNLFAVDKEVPSFLTDAGSHAGNEEVSVEDIAVPQLKILQPLSPELMMNIEGAKPGRFINSVTHDVFDSIFLVNLMYEHNFAVFKVRDLGGGKVSHADSRAEAQAQIDALGGNPADYQIADTGIHRMLGLNEDGSPYSPLIMYFSSTRKAASQRWNTQIQLKCEEYNVPRYASVWEMSITSKSNHKGTWSGCQTEFAGLIQDAELFNKASAMRTSLEAMTNEWEPPQITQQSS